MPGAAAVHAPPAGPALGPHTKIMGRRVVSYLIDLVIALALASVVFFAVADSATVPFSNVCDLVEGGICIQLGDRVWLAEGSNATIVTLVGIAYFVLAHVIIQGIVGGSPGKLVMGLRVVSANTSGIAGIGPCLIRSLLLIVDSFFFIGFIVALVTPNRQRIGDLAAKTLVVPKNVVGGATTTPAYAAAAPQQTAYQQPTGYEQSPSYQQPTAPQQPAAQPFAAPAAAQPTAEPAQPAASFEPAAPVEQPAETTASTSAAAAGEPQWDAARNAWIMWDASRNSWMVHDTATGQWRPI